MTLFDAAVTYTLANEGVFSNDQYDAGGETKYGITGAALTSFKKKFQLLLDVRIEDLTKDQAIQVYRGLYWRYDAIVSPMIAIKLFDLGVNFGLDVAVHLTQQALAFRGYGISVIDGLWGPETRDWINRACNDQSDHARLFFFKSMVLFAGQRYVNIVFAKPTQVTFIDGWLVRVARRPPDAISSTMTEGVVA